MSRFVRAKRKSCKFSSDYAQPIDYKEESGTGEITYTSATVVTHAGKTTAFTRIFLK